MASKANDLIVAVQEKASWSRRLSITVPADRVQRTRGRIAAQVTRGVRLPGFRKGKLPERVLEQRFGSSIDQETIDRLIQETYREALESEGITPISQGRIDEIRYDRGTDLTFEVEVEVKPEVELSRVSGFTVTRPAVDVGDEEVDALLERLRDERADWEAIGDGDHPDYGDRVLVSIEAVDADTEEEPRAYQIVLGEDQAIPDVEAAILTLAPGESGEFAVHFPEDFPDEARRGQEQQLRIELREAHHKVLPELNDEFARALGDFEDLDALRARVRSNLEEEATERAEAEVRRQLIDQVLAANTFEAPASMVDQYVGYMLGESEEERAKRSPEEEERYGEIREQLRPQAEWGVKRMLVIERLAEQEGLTATQDEIDERVEALATQHGRSPGEVWIQLEKSGQLEMMEREITEEKVFEYLKAQNTVS